MDGLSKVVDDHQWTHGGRVYLHYLFSGFGLGFVLTVCVFKRTGIYMHPS